MSSFLSLCCLVGLYVSVCLRVCVCARVGGGCVQMCPCPCLAVIELPRSFSLMLCWSFQLKPATFLSRNELNPVSQELELHGMSLHTPNLLVAHISTSAQAALGDSSLAVRLKTRKPRTLHPSPTSTRKAVGTRGYLLHEPLPRWLSPSLAARLMVGPSRQSRV